MEKNTRFGLVGAKNVFFLSGATGSAMRLIFGLCVYAISNLPTNLGIG